MKTVSQQLQEVRCLLAAGWTQHQRRRLAAGGAWRYCLTGAVAAVADPESEDYRRLVEQLVGQIKPGLGPQDRAYYTMLEWVIAHSERFAEDGLIYWNDRHGRTQAEVLALVDRALTEVTK